MQVDCKVQNRFFLIKRMKPHEYIFYFLSIKSSSNWWTTRTSINKIFFQDENVNVKQGN